MHRFALNSGALFLLNLFCGMNCLLKINAVVFSAAEVDACHMLGVEILRVRPQHRIQVCVHRLLAHRVGS